MKLINKHIKAIMIASGLITTSMLSAAIAPSWTLGWMFGEDIASPLGNIIVRNWGALVGIVGLLLLYGAFDPRLRRTALILAATSKIVFVSLVLLYGGEYLRKVGPSLVFDVLVVIVFVLYLVRMNDSHGDTQYGD